MTLIHDKLKEGPVEFTVWECPECGMSVLSTSRQAECFLCDCNKVIPVADTLTLKLNDSTTS